MRSLIQSPHIRHTTIILNLARKVLFDAKVSICPKKKKKTKEKKRKKKNREKKNRKKKKEKDNIPENTNVIVLPVDPSLLLHQEYKLHLLREFCRMSIRLCPCVSTSIHCIGGDKTGRDKEGERNLPRLL